MSTDQIMADKSADAVAMFGHLAKSGRSRRAAITEAARAFGLPVNAVYAAVEAAKKSGR
jgi:hypothetical protein